MNEKKSVLNNINSDSSVKVLCNRRKKNGPSKKIYTSQNLRKMKNEIRNMRSIIGSSL